MQLREGRHGRADPRSVGCDPGRSRPDGTGQVIIIHNNESEQAGWTGDAMTGPAKMRRTHETARSSGPEIEAGASKRVRRTRFIAALVRGNRDAGSVREATH